MKYLIAILFLLISLHSYSQCIKIDIILVADKSGSMYGHGTELKKAVTKFTDRFDLSENGIKIGIISFASDVQILTSLTSDQSKINNAIHAIAPITTLGSTNLTDALSITESMFIRYGRSDAARIVVIVSDGAPNNPDLAYDVAQRLQILDRASICGVFIDTNDSEKEYFQSLCTGDCFAEATYNDIAEKLYNLNICF